jgi:tetratricopeptide (TPR) repeat protein
MRRVLLITLLATLPLLAQEKLGTIVFPNGGKPAAQPAFLRGVAALHSFWYDEAHDSFVEAERMDPAFTLAYWGEAMTFNHPIWQEVDLKGGRTALSNITWKPNDPRDAMLVDALRALYGNGEKAERDAAYETAMSRVAAGYPNDIEVQVFYALSILGTMQRDEPDARKQIRAAAILEPLFASHPDHPGVLHYLIHAYDDPIHAPLGLRAAQRYAKVAPAAPHALHMPSHIFTQLGMWEDAARSNKAAYNASKEWVARKSLPSSRRDLHSLQWLQYAYLQLGAYDIAKMLIDEAAGDSHHEQMTRQRMAARYAVETGDLSALESLHGDLVASNYGTAHDAKVAEAIQREIDALAAKKAGLMNEALALAKQAVAIEDSLGLPSGPPDTFKPPHELYADLLYAANKRPEALQQYEIALARMPNRRLSAIGRDTVYILVHANDEP